MHALTEPKRNSTTRMNSRGPGITIHGRVKKPVCLKLQDLKTMESVVADDILLACGSGEPKGKIRSCRGVLLVNAIHNADVVITDHNDTKKMFIIAASDDGYKTVFSWQELFNTANGDGVLLVLEQNGQPLSTVEENRIDLMSVKDYLTGPRYVKRLRTLEIVMVE